MNKQRSHSFIDFTSVLFGFLGLLLMLLGCRDSLDEEINGIEPTGDLATKSVAVICIDVFVNWDGELIFLGSTCTSGGSSGGGGGSGAIDPGGIGKGYDSDDLVITGPYDAGGTSSGGTYNPTTGYNEYSYRLISKIYAINSNLNLVQKDQLVTMLNGFFGTNTGRMMYNYIASRDVNINFVVDPTINYPALYNSTTKTLKIRDFNTLLYGQLGEEIIHAVQHQCFYGDVMNDGIKNYEFEAKVYVDLAAIADGTGLYLAPIFTDNSYVFRTSYEAWINNIQNNLQGRFTDRNGFNSLCNLWNGYSGTCDTFFDPKLLNYFFRKPVPPQPPLQY